ncbi:hypothetical protein EXE59_15270 [Nocardioides eburneiflavus]|uniref:Uncharacterized protein n=1 Tax=Nocardioides eburneiflavus TaxID=2518372 RepID=A0A4Z1CKY0_9ACTN|nr:hypothetical protein EXE59_15270 [Nocardioides eburneiflavus]
MVERHPSAHVRCAGRRCNVPGGPRHRRERELTTTVNHRTRRGAPRRAAGPLSACGRLGSEPDRLVGCTQPWWSATRQLLFGVLAAGATYLVGLAIGANVS